MKKGRITEAHRTNFTVTADSKEYVATVRGVFHTEGDFPKVGDYVSFSLVGDEKAVIEEVLERTSVIKRRSVDGEEEQIMVTNVDLIFIVMGLDGDFNVNRLERYLLLAEQSSVKAVVILNKVDAVEDLTNYLVEVKSAVGETPVVVASATAGTGMEKLTAYITLETTAVLLGSSGAGKSTITNWLLATNKQTVNDIRQSDSHGRHTTISRQLFSLQQGGYLIDTPGMRELGMAETVVEKERAVFDRIAVFAEQCQFRNCDHDKSDGCAVLVAIKTGDLTDRELKNYHKLVQEQMFDADKNLSAGKRHKAEAQQRKNQQTIVSQKKVRFDKS